MATWENAIPIAATAASDSAQVEALVREHGRMVFKIAHAALRHREDAEDVVQEVFVKALQARQKLDQVDDPKAWLARIAWRASVDRLRARTTSRGEVPLEEQTRAAALHAAGASAEQLVAGAEMQQIVAALIATLPGELRDVLLLTAVQELTSQQVAAALRTSDATVRSRLLRARQMLRQKLAAVLEGNRER